MTKKLTPKELEDYEARLKSLLAILTGDIDKLEEEALGEQALPQDASSEGGADSYFQEFSLQLLERDENTVREVLQALERLRNGGYGACEVCTQPILKERLKMMPHARNCIECQRKEEEGLL
ncbi:MAG: TraR/DksA C4-type zinc finger protein [Planctomycetes bacterium]|nr:TraR/DksA C4-type zinc finger protein [Planctomycetota bacterium]